MNQLFVVFGFTCSLTALPIAPLAAVSAAVEQPVRQESLPAKQSGARQLEFTPPDDFDRDGAPSGNSSGGSRGDCLQQLLAMSPKPTEIAADPERCKLPSEDPPTLTVSEFPTFWFYVPDQGGQVSAELVLFDSSGQPPIAQQIVLSGEAGIVGVRLTQPIAVDRSYSWRFRINETPDEASMNPSVRGTVRRIALDPTLAAQLEAASAQEQVALYAANGIWQETLTALVQLRQTQPSSAIQADWTSLLASVNLGPIATAPVLDCCTSQPVAN